MALSGLAVKRGLARENDQGDLEFQCTVPAHLKARFFEIYPDFELRLAVPMLAEHAPRPSPGEAEPVPEGLAESQVMEVTGLDGFKPGLTSAPLPEAVRLARDPTFQEYAALMKKIPASEIENSDLFGLVFLQDEAGCELARIGPEQLAPIVGRWQEWLRSQGRA
jgi:hypothetical protein